ncbi:putative pyridoxal kinase [Serendipita sp. 401]|nr:putative pyridoxal kinase [Serendipita sp. 401]KAG9058901.1 putative pyridoxal kinase [Serendipita sp. 407]
MDRTVLSIQSHVAHGYVGGRAATFPLQLLGWEVDVVNTVNFSNHSGYRRKPGEGRRSTGEELTAIFKGLEMNGLLNPSRLLTGYTPNAECLSAIATLINKLRSQNSKLVYLLDPVIGDNGRLYVAEDVIPLYRTMLSAATIITPNWFEVETLVGFKLDSRATLQRAISTLHREYGVPHVVISSIPVTPQRAAWLPVSFQGTTFDLAKEDIAYAAEGLLCLSSSLTDDSEESIVHAAAIAQIAGYYAGVGDLFSATVLGYYDPDGDNAEQAAAGATPLSVAVDKAIRTTHAILRKTAKASILAPGASEDGFTDEELDGKDENRRPRRMRARELRLVGSADVILGGGESLKGTPLCHSAMTRWKDFWTS